MQEFPHRYVVTACGALQGDVELTAERLPGLRSAPPAEFDGPGNRWSPESLLVGAVGDCLILTFRAVAHVSKLRWIALTCDVTGTLDRIDRVTQFTNFEIRARLKIPFGTDPDRARQALQKAERGCLISNSLKGAIHLLPEVEVVADSVTELASA